MTASESAQESNHGEDPSYSRQRQGNEGHIRVRGGTGRGRQTASAQDTVHPEMGAGLQSTRQDQGHHRSRLRVRPHCRQAQRSPTALYSAVRLSTKLCTLIGLSPQAVTPIDGKPGYRLSKIRRISLARRYIPSVVGHESVRRNRRILLTTKSGFLRAKDRAKQSIAGAAKVGGQR